MKRAVTRTAVCAAVAMALAAGSAAAQQADPNSPQAIRAELDRLRQEYADRFAQLEARLKALEGGQAQPAAPSPTAPAQPGAAPGAEAATPPPAEPGGGQAGTLPVYGAGVSGSKVFNPDMAVIGDFLGAAGKNAVSPLPSLEMHESEASFQAVVDPYARADFFMSFGEDGVNLEEGFITFTSLPGGLLTRVGKMRAAFGKVNTQHNHILPWTDRPLVTQNLVGGEDGIDDAGISVARLIPNKWIFLEATGQVFRGDSGEDFLHASKRADLTYVGHLRAYGDLSEGSNLDVGASVASGHNASGVLDEFDTGRFTTRLYGVDATFRYRPLRRSIYRSFIGRSELIWSQREQPGGRQDAFGMFASADYQFARRWFAGLRYDRSDRAFDASLRDTGESVTLTYWPSEFGQTRGQFRRTRYAEGTTANEFLFQFQFSIGAHGAHPF